MTIRSRCRGGDFCRARFFAYGTFERQVKTRVVERLQKIVERSRLEGAQGVLIVGRDEDDSGRDIAAQKFEHVEAVALGHLHIEEEQIWLVVSDHRRSVKAGATFGDDLNCGVEPQEDGKIASRERFVVDDDGGQLDGLIFRAHRGYSLKGTETDTSTPAEP